MPAGFGGNTIGSAHVILGVDPTKFVAGLAKAKASLLTFKKVSLVGAVAGVAGLTAVIGKSVAVAADFEKAMAGVAAVTRPTTEEFAALTDKAKVLGRETKFQMTEIAAGMEALGRAGFEVSETIGAMDGVTALAAASGTDLGVAADITSKILRAMSIPAEEAGRVADVLAETAASANVDVISLGETFKYMAPLAKAAGFDLEEVSAAAGKLGDAGIQGSMAGTALRFAFSELIGESEGFVNKLAGLGLSLEDITDQQGDLLSFNEILSVFAAKGMGAAEMVALFGKRAGPAMAILVDSAPGVAELTEQLEGATGAAQRMADVRLDTLAGQVEILSGSWSLLLTELGMSVLPLLKNLLRNHVIPLVNRIAAWVGQMGGLIGMWGKFRDILIANKEPLLVIAGVLALLYGPAILIGLGKLAIALAATLWPIALIGVAAYAAVKYWDDIKEATIRLWRVLTEKFPDLEGAVTSAWEGMKAAVEPFREALQSIREFVSAVFAREWGTAWENIKAAFGAVWEGMKGVAQVGWDGVMGILAAVGVPQNVLDTLDGIKERMIAAFTDAWPVIQEVFRQGWVDLQAPIESFKDFLRSLAEFVTSVFKRDWDAAWGAIKEAFSSLWEGMTGVAQAGWDGVMGILAAVGVPQKYLDELETLKDKTVSVLSTAWEAFSAAWAGMIAATTEAWPRIRTSLGELGEAFSGLWSAAGEALNAIIGLFARLFGIGGETEDAVTAMEVLQSAFKVVWDIIWLIVDTAIGLITGALNLLSSLLRGDWSAAWQAFQDIIGTVWYAVVDLLDIIGLVDLITGGWERLRDATEQLWQSIKDSIIAIWQSIEDWVGSALQRFIDLFVAAWERLRSVTVDIWEKLRIPLEAFVTFFIGVADRILGVVNRILGFFGRLGSGAEQAYARAARDAEEFADIVADTSPVVEAAFEVMPGLEWHPDIMENIRRAADWLSGAAETGELSERNMRGFASAIEDAVEEGGNLDAVLRETLNYLERGAARYGAISAERLEMLIAALRAQEAYAGALARIGYQQGGPVPGIGRGDSIPALLEPGEFVVPRWMMQLPGLGGVLADIWRGKGFQEGGPVARIGGGGATFDIIAALTSAMAAVTAANVALIEALESGIISLIDKALEAVATADAALAGTIEAARAVDVAIAEAMEAVVAANAALTEAVEGGNLEVIAEALEVLAAADAALAKAIEGAAETTLEYPPEASVLLDELHAATVADETMSVALADALAAEARAEPIPVIPEDMMSVALADALAAEIRTADAVKTLAVAVTAMAEEMPVAVADAIAVTVPTVVSGTTPAIAPVIEPIAGWTERIQAIDVHDVETAIEEILYALEHATELNVHQINILSGKYGALIGSMDSAKGFLDKFGVSSEEITKHLDRLAAVVPEISEGLSQWQEWLEATEYGPLIERGVALFPENWRTQIQDFLTSLDASLVDEGIGRIVGFLGEAGRAARSFGVALATGNVMGMILAGVDLFSVAIEGLRKTVEDVEKTVREVFGRMRDVAQDVWRRISDSAGNLIRSLKGLIRETESYQKLQSVLAAIQGKVFDLLMGFLAPIAAVLEKFLGVIGTTTDAMTDLNVPMGFRVERAAWRAAEPGVPGVRRGEEGMPAWLSNLLERFGDEIETVAELFRTFGDIMGEVWGPLGEVTIPAVIAALTVLGENLVALGQRILNDLLPIFTEHLPGVIRGALDFFFGKLVGMGTLFVETLAGILPNLELFAQSIGDIGRQLPEVFTALAQAITPVINSLLEGAFIPLAEFVSRTLLPDLRGFFSAFGEWWAADVDPFLQAKVFPTLGKWLSALYNWLGKTFLPFLEKHLMPVVETVWGVVEKAFEGLGEALGNLWDTIEEKMPTVLTFLTTFIEGLAGKWIGMFETLDAYIQAKSGDIMGALETIWTSESLSLWDKVKLSFGLGAIAVWDWFKRQLQPVWDAFGRLGNALLDLWNVASPVLLPAIRGIATIFAGAFKLGLRAVTAAIDVLVIAVEAITGVFKSVGNFIIGIINAVIRLINRIPFVNIPTLPYLEEGGRILSEGLVYAHRDEVFLPAAVTSPLAMAGGGTVIDNRIYLDGRVLYQGMKRVNRQEERRLTGSSVGGRAWRSG